VSRRTAAPAALAAILLIDVVRAVGPWPLLVEGLLDEPAHLLTAWLLLTALLPERWRGLRPWALLGAVVIDLDHVPLYLWGIGTATLEGRPVTHSPAFAAVLLLAAAVTAGLRGRAAVPLAGLGAGLLLHLVRDAATGPGVPLWWPVADHSVLLPYPVYAVFLVLVTAGAVLRLAPRRSGAAEPQPLQ
jgi:inner membrane protein